MYERMYSKKSAQGFTLIELIVVIAIIGVFSSIVLVSASQARKKGVDSAVITNLVNAKLQAEVFFINNGESFSNGTASVCASYFAQDGVTKSARGYGEAARDAFNDASYSYASAGVQASSATRVACHALANQWAMESPLKTGGNWCVDYTGASKKVTTFLLSTKYVCPSS